MRLFVAAALVMLSASDGYAQLAPPNAAGITYGHIHLNVQDVEVHKRLWVDHFGGVIVQKGTFTVAKLPGTIIAFQTKAPAGPSEGTAVDHVAFNIRDLAETLKGWRAAGYQVTREFAGPGGARSAFLMGPDDLKIELLEDKALKVKASAHHVHFLVADPASLRDWYVKMFAAVPRKGAADIAADVPGMALTFEKAAMAPARTQGRSIDHIGFEINDLSAFVKALEAQGLKLDVAYREIAALAVSIAFVTDASGVYIELSEGYDGF